MKYCGSYYCSNETIRTLMTLVWLRPVRPSVSEIYMNRGLNLYIGRFRYWQRAIYTVVKVSLRV